MVFGFLGCMAQSRGAELVRDIGHVDLVVGTQKFHQRGGIRGRDRASESGAARALMDDARFSIVDMDEEAGSQETIREHVLTERQATAFVSIMQGCNMHCTFCIVPFTRGAERSRRIEEIVREVRGLVARGVKEVTLLGQIVNLYGRTRISEKRGRQEPIRAITRGGACGRRAGAAALHIAAPDRVSRRFGRGIHLSAEARWRTCICRCNRARIAF